MKEQIFIYTEEGFANSKLKLKGILPVGYKIEIKKEERFRLKAIIKHTFKKKELKEQYQKVREEHGIHKSNQLILKKIEPVFITKKSRFYSGIYFAHEYDKYVDGKIRRIEYSNGFFEYEVVCLDKTLSVLDGMYSEDERYGDKYPNGCGDYFEADEVTPWVRKEQKKRV